MHDNAYLALMSDLSMHFLTTRELAQLLRIKERKVYELAATGEVPCSRVTGKLLFPRRDIEAWLRRHSSDPAAPGPGQRADVVVGSHDPLLDWALRESRCGLATIFDSSLDGLDRMANGEGVACGVHVADDAKGTSWNIDAVRTALGGRPVVLLEWAFRTRGLIVAEGRAKTFGAGLASTSGMRGVPRQAEAGSQILLLAKLDQAGVARDEIDWTEPAHSETDAAQAVQAGKADFAFGLASVARQHGLAFVPVARERFDLVVDRKAWFDAKLQTFAKFCQSGAFAERARDLEGYDTSGQFTVHHNGP